MKCRVSFDFDCSMLLPEAQNVSEVETGITRMLLAAARMTHKKALQDVRLDGRLSQEEKSVAMAHSLRSMMATLMAEANMRVEALPDDAVIVTELPFEREVEA